MGIEREEEHSIEKRDNDNRFRCLLGGFGLLSRSGLLGRLGRFLLLIGPVFFFIVHSDSKSKLSEFKLLDKSTAWLALLAAQDLVVFLLLIGLDFFIVVCSGSRSGFRFSEPGSSDNDNFTVGLVFTAGLVNSAGLAVLAILIDFLLLIGFGFFIVICSGSWFEFSKLKLLNNFAVGLAFGCLSRLGYFLAVDRTRLLCRCMLWL